MFKVPDVPQKSRLGLDRLAMEKRAQKAQEEKDAKRIKLQVAEEWERQEEEEDNVMDHDSKKSSNKDKDKDNESFRPAQPQYRARRMDTPSHHGGVSQEALRRADERRVRDKARGMENY